MSSPKTRRERIRRAKSALTEGLPDLYAQTTPRKARLTPKSSKYWLSGYPKLVAEWHPTKNAELFPDVVSYGSARRVWWKCAHGRDHEWRQRVCDRVGAKKGCPFCAGRLVSVTNSLASRAPKVAAQWHPTANGTLTPSGIVAGSSRKVVWKCSKGPDHVWRASVGGRTGPDLLGCPYCANKAVSVTNSLAKNAPAIARQWHPSKNGRLRPSQVVIGSTTRVWWKCKKGADHVWVTTPKNRVKGSGCPSCSGKQVSRTNSLAALYPELAREWHPLRNGALTPRDVVPGSAKRIWWRCVHDKTHEWNATPNGRTSDGRASGVSSCPYCIRRLVTPATSLAAARPLVAAEWNRRKNGSLRPEDVLPGSLRRVWWRCREGHAWEAMVRNRAKGQQCPFCSPGHAVSSRNSLAARIPDLARQWHPLQNGDRTPETVGYGSGYRAWWRCRGSPRHEWQATVLYRAHRKSFACPHCTRLARDRGTD